MPQGLPPIGQISTPGASGGALPPIGGISTLESGLNAAGKKAATTEDYLPKPVDNLQEAWQAVKDLVRAAGHAGDAMHGYPDALAADLKSLVASHRDQFNQAVQSAKNGSGVTPGAGLSTALPAVALFAQHGDTLGHGAAAVLPGAGPMAAQTGDDLSTGHVGRGLVNAAALLGPSAVAETLPRVLPAVRAALDARAAGRTTALTGRSTADLMKAVPPSSTTPYSPLDLQRARPYLVSEHGTAPITSVETLRDAADSAVTQIEEHVNGYIAANPTDTIRTSPMDAVRAALAKNPRSTAAADGMKEVADLGLNQPLTLERADAIRLQLNAENKGFLKKNNYDEATAARVDPGFAARRAAAQSLRDGIYDQLESRGVDGVRQLRQDEGALLAIRNAAQRQFYNGEKAVTGTGSNGVLPRVAAKLTKIGSAAAGAAVGGPGGAAAGSVVGDELGSLIARPNLSRDALVARAFKDASGDAPSYPSVPPASPVRGLLSAPAIPLGASPDTSFVRGVPAQAAPNNPARLLTAGTPRVPAPADASAVRSVPGFAQPMNPARMLPPPYHDYIPMGPSPDPSNVSAIPARGIIVRDPKTGRFKRVFTTEPREPQ